MMYSRGWFDLIIGWVFSLIGLVMFLGKDGKVVERLFVVEFGNWFYNGGDLLVWYFIKIIYIVIIMLLVWIYLLLVV